MKKTVSMLLALIMVLSMMTFVSFASAEEYMKLTWVQGNSPAPIDNAMVLEELNKITRERLGCEIEIVYMSSDEVQTSIQSGEVYDMYFTCSWYNNFNMNVANGIFANIWGKVQEWTPTLWASMPESIWNLAKSVDGNLYAIPVYKDVAPENFIVYDAQVAQDAGIEIPAKIDSWDEMTPFLVALKTAMEANPELGQYPVNIGGAPAGVESSFDFIDRTPLIGVVFGDDKVCSVFDDEEIVNRYRTMHKWYQMGLVNPDAPTLTEDAISGKLHHISFVQAWDDYDYTPSRKFWVKMTRYAGPFVNTDGVQGAMNAFSVTLEDDPARFEMALKFQELVNTDREVRDILAYGVPGYHFEYRDVKDADGNVLGQAVVRTEAGSSNYTPWRFSQANYAINSIEASEETLNGTYPPPVLDQWDHYFAAVADAPISKISGFTFNYQDPIDFSSQYAEISAIKQEFFANIQCGVVDPDDPEVGIPAMRAKMEAAGLNDIIAEAQRQLDAYLGK
ncbi:MAG: ABC transporter substrate-binding protein [Clostridia bacterium]|nr:ABC transporter substrate-binding protein [Clostridia bacterium]